MPPPIMVHWGPYYFAETDDGDLYPTIITEVGMPPVAHTMYIFGVPDEGPKVMVAFTGEGPADPSGPISDEARFLLFGLDSSNTPPPAPEDDSTGGVTIVKEPPP